tara:strand:+ start:127 stop:585 length:459 start_codon:yes stop_codon:yes gene_type:complete
MLIPSLIASLLLIILYLVYRLTHQATPPPSVVTEVVQVPVPDRRVERSPEFRQAPFKRYKPQNFEQMGLLLGDGGVVLPLYGRESHGYRDRYQYYSALPGEQIYSLPVTHEDRECTEDIGCPEFYGGEKVSVLGKSGEYTVKIYETEQIYYS